MPRYLKDINYIIPRRLAEAMIEKAKRPRDKFLVAILYITGARPSEIRAMRKEDIWLSDEYLSVRITTLKLGETRKFQIKERVIQFIREETPFIEHIISWWRSTPNEKLIPISLRRVEQIIEEVSDKKLCPYNFRHTRLTKLAREGASVDELMFWKGALTTKSVDPYIRGKPIRVRYKID